MSKTYRIAVIPGDGIGKEVMPEGLRALEAVGARHAIRFDWKPVEGPAATGMRSTAR